MDMIGTNPITAGKNQRCQSGIGNSNKSSTCGFFGGLDAVISLIYLDVLFCDRWPGSQFCTHFLKLFLNQPFESLITSPGDVV